MAATIPYDPTNWYWTVATNPTQRYSSKVAAYVASSDPTYTAWVASGGESIAIATEADLWNYLAIAYPQGIAASNSAGQAAIRALSIPGSFSSLQTSGDVHFYGANLTGPNFTSAAQGLVPLSGGGTTNFLRADGTWAAPPGGGGAPTTSEYLVAAADATLTSERLATNTTTIIWDFTTAGQAKAVRAALTGDVTSPQDSATLTIAASAVTFAKMQNSAAAGLSVIGRSVNSAGVFAEISATSDGQVLRRSGTAIAFGALDVSSANAITGAAALTAANDTNVTLTLGGTPATALLKAASITAGWTGTLAVARGGTGAGTLTGLLQGTGTTAVTAITNSSTTGQALRVTGASTYAWGAVDLANASAVTGRLPFANMVQATTNTKLVGRQGTGGAGDWQEITLGTNLTMSGTTLNASAASGAATTLSYITMAAEGTLSAERVLTAGTGITITDGGANTTVTVAVNQAANFAWTGTHSFTQNIQMNKSNPVIYADDGNAVTNLYMQTKGANASWGVLNSSSQLGFEVITPSSIANYVRVGGAAASGSPTISVVGTDTNISLTLSAKGTGVIFAANPLNITTAAGITPLSVSGAAAKLNVDFSGGGSTYMDGVSVNFRTFAGTTYGYIQASSLTLQSTATSSAASVNFYQLSGTKQWNVGYGDTAHGLANTLYFWNNTNGLMFGMVDSGVAKFYCATDSTATTNGALIVAGGVGVAGAIYAGGAIYSTSPSAGIGYYAGAGGTITQTTNINTTVALDKMSGTITTVSSTLAAGAETSFTWTNANFSNGTDILLLMVHNYTGAGSPGVRAISAGYPNITIILRNYHASAALNAAVVIKFAVIRGVTS